MSSSKYINTTLNILNFIIANDCLRVLEKLFELNIFFKANLCFSKSNNKLGIS